MESTLLTGLAQLGGGFALAAAILLLHREALKAFREEMASERTRNDANLTTLFAKMDRLGASWQCRYGHQLPPLPPQPMNHRPGEAAGGQNAAG